MPITRFDPADAGFQGSVDFSEFVSLSSALGFVGGICGGVGPN